MVGMRDVARKAGVSLSTVSLVVNGTGYVSQEMREKVEGAISELGYVLKTRIRHPKAGRTGLVGVLMPSLYHPFFASLLSELHRHLADIGEMAVSFGTTEQPDAEQICFEMLRQHRFDGFISCSHGGLGDSWGTVDAPIVAFDRFLHPSIPVVNSDHEQSARLIAELLLGTGVKHVVEMGGPRSQFHDIPVDERGNDTSFPTTHYHRALEGELAKNGVHVEYVQIDRVSDLPLFGKAAETAFDTYPDVEAIVAPDLAAACSVRQAIRRGIGIPDRLQVVAYDGTFVTDVAGMRITSVRQNLDGIARGLVHQLEQEMQRAGNRRNRIAEHKVVGVKLVKGDTTR